MLHNLGSNKVEISKSDGTRVFYSYNTPVAAFVPGAGYLKTEKRWSVTTSKHISQWMAGAQAETRPQAFFDALQQEG